MIKEENFVSLTDEGSIEDYFNPGSSTDLRLKQKIEDDQVPNHNSNPRNHLPQDMLLHSAKSLQIKKISSVQGHAQARYLGT